MTFLHTLDFRPQLLPNFPHGILTAKVLQFFPHCKFFHTANLFTLQIFSHCKFFPHNKSFHTGNLFLTTNFFTLRIFYTFTCVLLKPSNNSTTSTFLRLFQYCPINIFIILPGRVDIIYLCTPITPTLTYYSVFPIITYVLHSFSDWKSALTMTLNPVIFLDSLGKPSGRHHMVGFGLMNHEPRNLNCYFGFHWSW